MLGKCWESGRCSRFFLLDWRVELRFLQIRESSNNGEFDLRLPSNTKPGCLGVISIRGKGLREKNGTY